MGITSYEERLGERLSQLETAFDNLIARDNAGSINATAGRVPFGGDNGNLVDDANLSWDNTTKRLLIDTALRIRQSSNTRYRFDVAISGTVVSSTSFDDTGGVYLSQNRFASLFQDLVVDAATNATSTCSIAFHRSTGSPASGFGSDQYVHLHANVDGIPANNIDRPAFLLRTSWGGSGVDAARAARAQFFIFDFNAAREVIRIEADGTAAKLSFFASAAVVKQAVIALSMSVGTGDNTVADVGAVFSQTTLNNNFRDCVDKINALRTILVNYGLL